MVNVKVGQTIRVNIAVWDFCGELGNKGIMVHTVAIDALPQLSPQVCQDISSIGIEFKFVTSGDTECKNCQPDIVHSIWGTAYTDSQGLAYIDHVITDADMAAYQTATASGMAVKVLACITDSKGQQVLANGCSETLTVLTPTVPTYFIDFKMVENTSGILETLKSYASMITAGFNTLIPLESGWNVYSTEVYPSNGIMRLYLSEAGSWGLVEIAEFILSLLATVIGGILLIIFLPVGLVGFSIIVVAVIAVNYLVYNIINQNSELSQVVDNLKTKTQEDTSEDQVVSGIFDQYEKSAKTKDDCLNLLNGLRITTSGYLDKMQKSFPKLYTPAIKRQYQATTDNTIKDFKDGKITCDQATMTVLAARATAKADTSTNFNGNYIASNGYVPQKPNCWIAKPLSDECVLSAETGMWIVGTLIAVIGLGITYWAVTRKPEETKIFIESAKETASKAAKYAKEEYERARSAYGVMTAPAPSRLTGAPTVPAYYGG